MSEKTKYSIDLTDDEGRLDYAQQVFQRFCEDMVDDPAKARVRLISRIQIGIRDGIENGFIEPLIYSRSRSTGEGQ